MTRPGRVGADGNEVSTGRVGFSQYEKLPGWVGSVLSKYKKFLGQVGSVHEAYCDRVGSRSIYDLKEHHLGAF